jgi:hypothetical protein
MLIRSARVSTGRGRCLVWLQPPGKIGRDQKGGGSVFAAADSLMRGQALHLSVSVVPADQTTASQHLAVLVLAMLAAAGWIATHRYPGLWHDAVLYAAQAIYRLDPRPVYQGPVFCIRFAGRLHGVQPPVRVCYRELGAAHRLLVATWCRTCCLACGRRFSSARIPCWMGFLGGANPGRCPAPRLMGLSTSFRMESPFLPRAAGPSRRRCWPLPASSAATG